MKRYKRADSKREQGYTLLEYCAGAAVIAGILWGALTAFGGSMEGLLGSLATWADNRAGQIQAAN